MLFFPDKKVLCPFKSEDGNRTDRIAGREYDRIVACGGVELDRCERNRIDMIGKCGIARSHEFFCRMAHAIKRHGIAVEYGGRCNVRFGHDGYDSNPICPNSATTSHDYSTCAGLC